ncbi:MAG: carbon monoxide dehydrogenase [Pelotomaculum sp.]|nr:carbon monoxide dehydrogenase [Pelotomaculum sp.]
MKLAVSGKGGVGKTTVAAAMVRLFSERCRVVYAIDADPDVCLAAALGIPDDITGELRPLVEMREKMAAAGKSGEDSLTGFQPCFRELDEYCIAQRNIRYLRMGGVKKGGSSCYCRENTFLNAVVSSLLLEKQDVVVMDMGAGIEHLSRGTARGVDLMLVVVEPSLNSINTAGLVKRLAAELGIRKIRVIANKIRNELEKEFIISRFSPEEVLGFIRFDEGVWRGAMTGCSLDGSEGKLSSDMREIYERVLKELELK